MGSDGFRVVRMAWFGPFDPKKFMEMQKRNPQIRPDEYQFVKDRATLLKEIGMMASRNARVSFKGDSVLGVDVQGVTDNIAAINNVQIAVPINAPDINISPCAKLINCKIPYTIV